MNLEKYQQYSKIARGLEQADLVLKDARIINVFTEEIIRGDIAIQEYIAKCTHRAKPAEKNATYRKPRRAGV